MTDLGAFGLPKTDGEGCLSTEKTLIGANNADSVFLLYCPFGSASLCSGLRFASH
jgi:hypothetical protein